MQVVQHGATVQALPSSNFNSPSNFNAPSSRSPSPPITPPPETSSDNKMLEISASLIRLSVSPRKPRPLKKRKINANPKVKLAALTAPIFQNGKGQLAKKTKPKNDKKRVSGHMFCTTTVAHNECFKKLETVTDDLASDASGDDTMVSGRPRL
jgi:hypothetical protein